MHKPVVSVVLPVYNGAHYLAEAIESILLQTFHDFELIIINDGSTDKSLDIIKDYAMKHTVISVIDCENKGLVASLNEGIANAKGKYIARMDQDDISLPTRFEKQVVLFEQDKDLVLCGTWATIIDSDGKFIKNSNIKTKHKDIINDIEHCKNPFFHPSVMFRKKDNVFYNETALYCEDYEMWLKYSTMGKLLNIPEYLLKYRIDFASITNSKRYLAFYNVSQLFFQYVDAFVAGKNIINTPLDVSSKSTMNRRQKMSSYLYSKGLFYSYNHRQVMSVVLKVFSIFICPQILFVYIKRIYSIYRLKNLK